MDVFNLRGNLINDYSAFVKSYIQINDERINKYVHEELNNGLLWPEPLIQLNPSFESGELIDELIENRFLHPECGRIFRIEKDKNPNGFPLRLHKHQADAIKAAKAGNNYVLTTGTGSGKSLSYIIPIVDHVLTHGSGRGIQAIVIYPMNALANSQFGELEKFLCYGYPNHKGPVTFGKYTGQEIGQQREDLLENPPDILLTNYVMLEYILTRPDDKRIISSANNLQFLVLDELHTYRGRQGADVAMLVRRLRDICGGEQLKCVGTSATLATADTYEQQCIDVAEIATLLFGSRVKPENVIGETLRRATPSKDFTDHNLIEELKASILSMGNGLPIDYDSFINNPLSVWIESVFGLTTEPGTERLIRSKPRSISGEDGAAKDLSELTGLSTEQCTFAIQKWLLHGYVIPNKQSGFPVFAFRLHQFINRGDTVYASLEDESKRYITVYGQQYVPNDRNRKLLPIAFCRECGQEYYVVRENYNEELGKRIFEPRDLEDRFSDDEKKIGYLYTNAANPWPADESEFIDKLPDDFVENPKGVVRIKSTNRQYLPVKIKIKPDGSEGSDGHDFYYIPAPFRFCLHCGVAYDARQRSDFAKLGSLGSEGRSTATSILCLSTVRSLQNDENLPQKARKILSFTDNRQDASLQAGHFNDFIEVGLLRAALYKAVFNAGDDGLLHDVLTQKVFDELGLPIELFAIDPNVRFQALRETQKSFRNVIGYRLYQDLKRGWRIMLPNLEQCGLLEIQYASLEEACEVEDIWQKSHPALVEAKPVVRQKIAKVLLDLMRRELAIKVDYLSAEFQERIKIQSNQKLIAPWAIDENEKMEHAGILFPRSKKQGDFQGNIYLSERSGFGRFLRRVSTFPDYHGKISMGETADIILNLLDALKVPGLVEVVQEKSGEEDVPGYQLASSALIWKAGDGTKAFHDPIRIPNESAQGARTNEFFINFYKIVASETKHLKAKEHTAQVPYELRVERENDFREGNLPILYCSPTMELGVDISQLNAVNLRNIPPTPANYAQRSGRAGRSGQPALVFTYCSTGSPHDQYFFKRPEAMVAGAVTSPRIDLANEDLIRSHIHAIWLAETGISLRKTPADILDLNGEVPSLAVVESVWNSVVSELPKNRAMTRATNILASIDNELRWSDWYSDGWLKEVFCQVSSSFDLACERWRELYRAALRQREMQHRIIGDASRSEADKKQAMRLRQEAESQIALLTSSDNVVQSDFYSYRYFASEGFLPGYNFPRLPLSAYIPGRRRTNNRDEFLSRPRFLAISEFGPRSIVYHEGSRYEINKVIIPVTNDDILTSLAKLCPQCGYLHPIHEGEGKDLCEICQAPLEMPLRQLLRLQNVSTKRRARINCDEEERLRLGYELKTAVRFEEHGGRPTYKIGSLEIGGTRIASIIYGHAATIWRINLGWSRRANKEQYGFILDTERGYWSNSESLNVQENDDNDPMSNRTMRVVPYVEDRRNCLLFKPEIPLTRGQMASLQAAIKSSIQVLYQLEDNELAAEPLPSRDIRQQILFYEAAEGGAGVLRRLLDEPDGMAKIAGEALRICHFDAETGEDHRRGPRTKEDCEAACYDCLMNYGNQTEHLILDRQQIKDILLEMTKTKVIAAPASRPRAEHLEHLLKQVGSGLERDWLMYLEQYNLRLPSNAQMLIQTCITRPDFFYEEYQAAVYIDGPPHDYPDRQERDAAQTESMEDRGYTVVRFNYQENWDEIIDKYPYIFGRKS
ncbi:DEAD/DEAH box helicase [Candidatus Parcubacteria bacterium]|nr:MAG: DEAD/DEAH box helicase [Candidatus Parcubacteria bacterium]